MSRSKHTYNAGIGTMDLAPCTRIEFEGIVIDLLMDFLTESKNCPSYNGTDHDHFAYELFIIEDGTVDICVNGEALTFGSGEFILIAPHVKHRTTAASPSMKRFSVRFSLRSGTHLIEQTNKKYLRDALSHDERVHILNTISELRKLDDAPMSPLSEYRMRAQFGIVLSYVLERFMDMNTDEAPNISNPISLHSKIENYLYLNYSQSLTLEELAAYLSYSRTQTQRIIEACFGMSFTDKLREIRISVAKTLLSQGELSIDEIAEKCGYETRQGFEAMFQKHVGVTPNRYRKQNQK